MLTTAQAVRENKKRKKQPGGGRNPSPVGSSPPSLMVEMETLLFYPSNLALYFVLVSCLLASFLTVTL